MPPFRPGDAVSEANPRPVRDATAAPASRSEPVTKGTPLPAGSRALYVGTGGSVIGRLEGDTADRSFLNVANGAVLPFAFQVVTIGSTAADLVALY